jgi:hypothetical protein
MNSRRVRSLLAVCLILLTGIPVASVFSADEAPALSQEQLDQMLAPIALYPDPLLSQIFMASTYPLEVVEAARWSKANPDVQGDNAVKAVTQETWDPSVKSLVAFPSVLSMMNDKLDWTQQLGDAFLADQAKVMQTVQGLRKKAQQAGQLKSNEQQTVTTQAQTIIIQPAQPQVVYVPTYNPTVVYGTWPYPAYPPVYFPPPPGYAFAAGMTAAISFGVGIAVADAMFGDCDWGHNDVNINVNRYNNINVNNINRNTNINNVNRNTNINNRTTNTWQHDASHRKGVAYRDNATQSRYAGNAGRSASNVDARRDYRGYDSGNAGGATRASGNVGATNNLGATQRDTAGSAGQRDTSAAQRSNAASTRVASADSSNRSSALSSSSNRNIEQAASTRGRSSTQGMQYNRGGGGGGGGARGGGGFSRRP